MQLTAGCVQGRAEHAARKAQQLSSEHPGSVAAQTALAEAQACKAAADRAATHAALVKVSSLLCIVHQVRGLSTRSACHRQLCFGRDALAASACLLKLLGCLSQGCCRLLVISSFLHLINHPQEMMPS